MVQVKRINTDASDIIGNVSHKRGHAEEASLVSSITGQAQLEEMHTETIDDTSDVNITFAGVPSSTAAPLVEPEPDRKRPRVK